MARQLRLVVPHLPHLVALAALPGVEVFSSPDDRARFVDVIHEAAVQEQVQVHALALLAAEVRALVTPGSEQSLARFAQAVGRRYVATYNRARGRSGTVWAGRFRSAPVQRGRWVLDALRYVDAASSEPGLASGVQRSGGARLWPLIDPPEYWALGNTPFERETAYARLLADPLPPTVITLLGRCLSGGWPCGDDAFAGELSKHTGRTMVPRPRGRPRKAPV